MLVAAFFRTCESIMTHHSRNQNEPTARGEPLSARDRAAFARHLNTHGEAMMTRLTGLSRMGVARAAAGLPLYAATRAIITSYLDEVGR